MRLFAGTPFDIPPRCERCGKLEEECQCGPPLTPPQQQRASLRVEKRKKGKVVTVIRGLAQEPEQLAMVLTRLKDACGTGGTLKDAAIELQGDHLGRATELLKQAGYQVAR